LMQISSFHIVAAQTGFVPLTDHPNERSMGDLIRTDVSGIQRIWAVDDGEKIKREDLQHPLADSSKNMVWDGEKIQIFGARNEIVAFQLIIEAGASGASDVDRLRDLPILMIIVVEAWNFSPSII
jgi:hypothetical protein